MSEFEKITLEKLDVDNYATWSVKMRFLLVARELWDPVVGGADVDTRSDQKALALIGLYVRDHHLALLSKCKTAKEAWEALESDEDVVLSVLAGLPSEFETVVTILETSGETPELNSILP